jgi:MFS family permease
VTCFLVIIGAILSATAVNNSFGIYTQLCIYRFILGVGVGGEYPLSASITSESSSDTQQARNLAMVFSMQGFGTLLCSLVLVCVTNIGDDYNMQWRVALGLGALPMICAFYFRWKMHETSWKQEAQVNASVSIEFSKSTILFVIFRYFMKKLSRAITCLLLNSQLVQVPLFLTFKRVFTSFRIQFLHTVGSY